MRSMLRTVLGLGLGSILAGLFGMLGRFQRTAGLASRRTFVRNAALGATGVVGAIGAAGFGALLWPLKTGAFGKPLTVSPENVPPPGGPPFLNSAGKFFLVHNQDGLLALYTKCPHLGCTVPWVGPADSPQAFQCPCHGSMYDYNGVRTGGPAPRPMDYMRILNEGGRLVVDTGAIKKRNAWDPSQAFKV